MKPSFPLYRIERFAESHRASWEDFVAHQARNSHFMHSRSYLDYHRDRFLDHSLLLFRGENLSAILPAHREGNTLATHRGLSFGGWLVGHRFRLADWIEAFRLLTDHARGEGFDTLDYRPTPPWYHRAPGEEDVYWFEQSERGSLVTIRPTSLLRLPPPIPFSKNRRHALHLGKKRGFKVQGADYPIAPIMELVTETLARRHGATPVHTASELEWLQDRFPENIHGYAIEQDGKLVATVIVFIDKCCVKLQYVGYAPDQGSGAMESIYAHLFEHPDFQGRWFDFGTSMSNDGIDASLFAYKESFGARMGLYRHYLLFLDP